MTYSPIDPTALYYGLLGDAAIYPTLVANGQEIYAGYTPTIAQYSRTISIGASVTAQRILVWPVERNKDLLQIRVKVRATGTGGSSTITVIVGGASASATVSGASATYTINVTPLVRGPCWAEMRVTTPGGVTCDVERMQCYLVGTTPASPPLGSGYIGSSIGAGILGANRGVASEHASRWLAQAIRIARDRPALVAQHMTRFTTTGAKSVGDWQASSTTFPTLVGRLILPRCDNVTRQYVLTAFGLESGSGASAVVSIGSQQWTIPSFGGTAGQAARTVVSLGPGPHPLRAAIQSGAGNTARFAWFGVHREAVSVDGS